MTYLLSFLSVVEVAEILIVWPQDGPGAWLRERPRRAAGQGKEVLDCYVCMSFWSGLALSPLWWSMCREPWTWAGCLMPPSLFWIVLRNPAAEEGTDSRSDRH